MIRAVHVHLIHPYPAQDALADLLAHAHARQERHAFVALYHFANRLDGGPLQVHAARASGSLFGFAKLIHGDSELLENLVEKRRADLPAAVDRNTNRATVWMNPTFVASGLAAAFEPEACGHAPEFLGAG